MWLVEFIGLKFTPEWRDLSYSIVYSFLLNGIFLYGPIYRKLAIQSIGCAWFSHYISISLWSKIIKNNVSKSFKRENTKQRARESISWFLFKTTNCLNLFWYIKTLGSDDQSNLKTFIIIITSVIQIIKPALLYIMFLSLKVKW